LKLGFVRAIALLAAAQKNMTVQDFTPCQIKEILTGTGKATKQQIQDRVKNLFPSATKFVSYDSSDAIAAAICGCF
jgi:crossover junction endodeoxyribonuclease RuvC